MAEQTTPSKSTKSEEISDQEPEPILEPRTLLVRIEYWGHKKEGEETIRVPITLTVHDCTRIEFSPNAAKTIRLASLNGQYKIEMKDVVRMEVEVNWWNVAHK